MEAVDAHQLFADLLRVYVEERLDAELVALEGGVAHERGAEVSDSGERHVPDARRRQYVFYMSAEAVDVISDAALAYLAEVREVFSDLARLYAEHLTHLERRDDLAALFLHHYKQTVILYKPFYRRFRYLHNERSSSFVRRLRDARAAMFRQSFY